MDSVGKTSLLVAAMRAAETQRSESEGRLFVDPFAHDLAGSEGRELFEKAIAEVGDQPAIPLRTRYFDDRIQSGLAEGIRQVVILAAGMDARAYRLDFPPGTRLFEIDRPAVLDHKREKLGSAQPRCERLAIAADLREDWASVLLQAGMNPRQPTLWLVEGLLMYLEETSVLALFKRISELSAPRSLLLFDLLGRSLLDAPFMQKQLQVLEKMGAPWLFGSDEPEKLIAPFGWSAHAIQPGEVAPSRWPHPIAPRHVPNVPRGFLIEARKIAASG